ncbi:putative head stabilization/decoration protein [Erwinia phage Hena1]|uniref:Putative head stabilization/decoration protein n=1 Tax=Erwinia phage Hena1 TaxID=2678601 RepID=A0A6B9J5S4_9CAUD|nr:head decoration [Erwinia phage Hena1]QGZ16291.1 putative head stabilization/decoration protein [Erwinia phage Hena1]
MANPIQGYYSDLVLGKVDSSDQGYSFLEMPIVFAATTKAGIIVNASGAPVAAADAATAYGVITDRDLYPAYDAPREFVVGTTYNLVVGVRGLTLNQGKIFFADGTTVINAAAKAALEARGLKITDKYYDGSVDINVTPV